MTVLIRRGLWVAALGVGALVSSLAAADPAPFDLAGPELEVTVTRAGTTLPIGAVPNLAPGDRLAIRAELPPDQSAHYLLVTAFLRGATNPPPKDWFYRCETWHGACAAHGQTVVVPADAQQVLLFLAPQTGGDFRTLVGAVRGQPGAFVRSSQDLNQASLDRSRLDRYLAAVRALDLGDRARLKTAAPLLARSLAIKMDDKCLDKIPELQAPCLMQGGNSLILNDGHSTSIVEALTAGPAADLAMQASYTPKLGYGYDSPYVASILDIARLMTSFDTAQYQYIPALAAVHGDRMSLALNSPPSFHDPKSVLVTALPAVEPAQPPPLHAVDPKQIYCARKTELVLPVEGAPLAFSTQFAHQMHLHVADKNGVSIDLPADADPESGGFRVDTSPMTRAHLGDGVRASLRGEWGFGDYQGPTFQLWNSAAAGWSLPTAEDGALIVGREDTIHLRAGDTSCLDKLVVRDSSGQELKPEWKSLNPNDLEVKLPLKDAKPGPLTLLVEQYGSDTPQPIALQAFADAGHLDRFIIHAGDNQGVLQGARLDLVARLELKGVDFLPGTLSTAAAGDTLTLAAAAPAGTALPPPSVDLRPGESLRARITLKDGRVLNLDTLVAPRRPAVSLITENIEPSVSAAASHVQLNDKHDLPQDARLRFSLRAVSPATFTRDETIDVATTDQAFSVTLRVGAGITLENAKVALATLDPASAFGGSAAGPLQFRATVGGVSGDWQPLVTLVRLPALKDLLCPGTPDLACKLSGSNLFLIDAVASDAGFTHAVEVPDGFPGDSLPVPHPVGGDLYLKLRDDVTAIDRASVPITSIAPAAVPAPAPASASASAPTSVSAAPTPSATAPPAPQSNGAEDRPAGL